jgi:uncharacterized protein (DUF4415 family)
VRAALRIDRDVLDYFQADGPGWQERMMRRRIFQNDVLRAKE